MLKLPYLFYLNKSQSNLTLNKFKLIPIHELIRNIDILVNQIGEISFYKKFELKIVENIYFSTVFYFELFDLPLFVLYTPKINNQNFINIINQETQANLLRKSAKRFSKKSIKSISPDRGSIRSKSPDNKSGISGDISDISRNITVSNMSNLEEVIWKNIISNTEKNEILSEGKINSNEKAEFSGKYKEIKNFLSKIIDYFNLASKEKLEIFLNQIEQKQENGIDFGIQKENEIKKHMKRISNENITEFNYIKTDMKEKYGYNLEENNEKVKERNIKMNDLNMNNIKKKEQVEEENQYNLEENQNNMENQDKDMSMSFSGIIEMKEEEKINNNKNKPKKENKKMSNPNNNLFSSEDKNNINKNINRFNSCEISSQSCNNKIKTTSDKEINIINSNEKNKVISEFKINDKIINKNYNESSNTNDSTQKDFSNSNISTNNNNISTNNNSLSTNNNNIAANINIDKEQNAEFVKNNTAKKKRKLLIINES